MTDYWSRFYEFPFSNGLFAGKAAAFVGLLALAAAVIFVWRMWLLRGDILTERGWFRVEVYFWLAILFVGLAGNRISVVLFYRGIRTADSLWPTFFSIGLAVALMQLAFIYTRDKCGHKGWLSLLALASIAMVLS